ncbi:MULTISPECIES: DUF2589 domain-containing protein [unclassified Paludibacterium]|uniref:DUF2589 domain-containing protein n=1 Tax=unclassified Paludibacterium TaxID=2618429 RepID=UPI001C045C1E|nr:DUF2589 domain-containing protein [Paludibacterium sp. B53371]BEV73012.1 hypothetical protein THUN1379_24940 [Paludibacterium sp. THUN1379]
MWPFSRKRGEASSGGGAEPPSTPPARQGPESPSAESAVGLQEITRGLLNAAAAANQMVAHQYMRLLDQFFDVEDDGSLSAKTVQLVLDEQHEMTVPLVTLMSPRGMAMERMKVNLAVRTDAVDSLPAEEGAGQDRTSQFRVSMAPISPQEAGVRDSRFMNIEIEFVAQQPPEGMMRLVDEYTNRVLPQALAAKGEGA